MFYVKGGGLYSKTKRKSESFKYSWQRDSRHSNTDCGHLRRRVEQLEGVLWGPVLVTRRNGGRPNVTVVLVSKDGFISQPRQIELATSRRDYDHYVKFNSTLCFILFFFVIVEYIIYLFYSYLFFH